MLIDLFRVMHLTSRTESSQGPKHLVSEKSSSAINKINRMDFFKVVGSNPDRHILDITKEFAVNKVICLNRTMFFHGDTSEFFGSNELIRMYSESRMQLHMHSIQINRRNLIRFMQHAILSGVVVAAICSVVGEMEGKGAYLRYTDTTRAS
jgi:hypothetical protein